LDNLGKTRHDADLIKALNALWANDPRNFDPSRLLIEGVRTEAPFSTETDLYVVEEVLKIYASTGAYVSIDALNVDIIGSSTPTSLSALPMPNDFHEQAEMYAKLMKIYKEHSESISGITFAGLPFNTDLTPTLAYFAIADPDGYLAGNFNTLEKIVNWLEVTKIPGIEFTELDAIEILKHELGMITLTAEQFVIYDLNGDGAVDSLDALIILKRLVGLL
jgi:hypothetical protein